ncbi:MAG: PilZ domain-containing protein [Pyrinomonadaceae bacterium]|nr:PilZ domain-containing protein [Pyrinomonadaceae bacterium]MBP9110947.1 PilZ domain-containing protein [Pyrinomonadaceae bacterium]
MLPSNTEQSSSPVRAMPPSTATKENRRIQRISLPLPVRVEVRIDSNVNWNEVTRLSDVSAFGCGFSLKRPVKRGRLIQLTIPMPRQLRSFDYSEPQYRIWGIVRRCISVERTLNPEYSVGVAFTGKAPPAGFLDHPSMLFDITRRDESEGFWHLTPADLTADESDLPKELRKQTRYFIPEQLIIEQVDPAGNVLFSETTVTENISLGGASVFTTLNAEAGHFVRVTSDRFNVTILSVVRGKRVGEDGITRLHIEFIDRLFPLEGIE